MKQSGAEAYRRKAACEAPPYSHFHCRATWLLLPQTENRSLAPPRPFSRDANLVGFMAFRPETTHS
jgi:hypothetical protein